MIYFIVIRIVCIIFINKFKRIIILIIYLIFFFFLIDFFISLFVLSYFRANDGDL